jgi:hypothetical protein
MSFSQEVRDFLGGFQVTTNALRDRRSAAERQHELDQKGIDAEEANLSGGDAGSRAATSDTPSVGGSGGGTGGSRSLPSFAGGGATMTMPGSGGAAETKFISALKDGGLTNPNGLAAFAAYARHESGYSPKNIAGAWSDPSERGQAGTSGGLLSWRNERLSNMRRFTAGASDPVVAQAKFALAENPALTRALNSASSPEEANRLLANAWKFKGYNRPGGEFAARLGTTRSYLRRLSGQQADAGDTAIPDDLQPTITAARGGSVPTREELEWRMREMPAEEAPADDDVATQVQPAALPDEAPPAPAPREVQANEPVAEQLQAIPAEETSAVPAQEAKPSRAPKTVTAKDPTPLPPRRPAELTPAGNEAPKGAIPDTGGRLPGEGMSVQNPTGDPARDAKPEPTLGDVIKDGLDAIGEFFGFKQAQSGAIRDPAGARYMAFAKNEGAATPEEVRAVDQKIDPNGEMTADARALRRLYAGYSYFLKQGQPDKARNYARSMLMYVRGHMQAGGTLAQQQLQNGDVAGAAKTLTRAHNEFPDGQTAQVEKVGPGGVQYAVYDENGDLTERGRMSIDQMMQAATGMRNGTEWFRQLDLLKDRAAKLTPAQQLKQRQEQERQDALTAYEETATPDTEFLNSMKPEQRAAYDKLDRREKLRLRKEFLTQRQRETQNDLARQRQELAESKAGERQAASDKKSQDEQEANAIGTKIQILQEKVAENPDDTEARKQLQDAIEEARTWGAADGGRALLKRQLDNVILGNRGRVRANAGTGTAPATGVTGGGKGTAKERAIAPLQQQYAEKSRQYNNAGVLTQAQMQDLDSRRAEIGYRQHEGEFDPETLDKIDANLAKLRGVDDPSKLDQTERFAYHAAAGGIARANAMSIDQSIDIVRNAVLGGRTAQVLDDGRVQFGDSPPVNVSADGLAQIALLRRRAREQAAAAQPKVTEKPNPFGAIPEDPAQARMQGVIRDADQRYGVDREAEMAQRRARKQGQKEQLLREVGPDGRPDMDIPQLRKLKKNQHYEKLLRESVSDRVER